MRNRLIALTLIHFAVLSSVLPTSSSHGAVTTREDLIIGFLEHFGSQEPVGFRVRIAFKKDKGLWKAFRSDFNTPAALDRAPNYFPKEVSWNVCLDGGKTGSLKSRNPKKYNLYMDVGLHDIVPGSHIPTIGEPSLLFSGFLHSPVYRPLLLNSRPYCRDPGLWKPYRPEEREVRSVYDFLRKKFKVQNKRASKAKVEVNKSYESRSSDARLISLTITGARILPETDEISENDMNIWCYTSGGEIRYLNSEMLLLDAGDYDGDGEAEIVFKVQKYNYDGYILYYDNLKKHLEFGWSYH